MLATAGCIGSQRRPDGPLTEASPREQIAAIAAVQWQTLFDRGQGAAAMGDLTRAEQYMAAAMLRGGPPATILPRLLRVCVVAHRYRAALSYAEPYLNRREGGWPLRYVTASIRLGLGELQMARRDLEIVVQLNPRHAEAHYLLATILRDSLGDPAGADEHFRHYLEIEPHGPHAEEARAGLLQQVPQQVRR